ncbi:MAG TPA: alpha/beta hydrolase [Candidatus Saccharimonadales bacterium]|nr:alpha/beta hydrolase [Candidatus Saccharimonadales bacterium]
MAKRWTKPKLHWTKKTKVFVFAGVGLLAAVLVGFITYYNLPMKAEARELGMAQNMMTVRYRDTPNAVVLAPLAEAKKGIVLYPGARIDPAAYAYKMSLVAQSGVAVVIVKPPLHAPPLDWRPIADYTGLVESVGDWYVAGHSLGGVKACQVASGNAQLKGLLLFGAYCAGSISGLSMPVVSIGGSADRITTPDDIAKRKADLPATTTYEMIEGLNHSGFADYGTQGGDGDMAVSDIAALSRLTSIITRFVGTAAAP